MPDIFHKKEEKKKYDPCWNGHEYYEVNRKHVLRSHFAEKRNLAVTGLLSISLQSNSNAPAAGRFMKKRYKD